LKSLPLVALAGVAVVACWFFLYAHALADDYSRGAVVRQRGLWGAD
jgi:ABC-type transport system involved in cytochrome c biogenesis permease subunit